MFPPGILKASLENRVYLGLAGLLAGIGGLGVVWLLARERLAVPVTELQEGSASVLTGQETDRSEIVAGKIVSGFGKEAIRFCMGEVRLDRSFVVFKNGTCVLIHEPSADPLTEAIGVLVQAAQPGAVFATAIGEDGSVMVTYRERLFQRFSKEDAEALRTPLEDGFIRLLTSAEAAAREADAEIPESTRLGLLGRWCLMKDAEEKQPLRIIRERRNHTATVR